MVIVSGSAGTCTVTALATGGSGSSGGGLVSVGVVSGGSCGAAATPTPGRSITNATRGARVRTSGRILKDLDASTAF
jgi:hypothetical protein